MHARTSGAPCFRPLFFGGAPLGLGAPTANTAIPGHGQRYNQRGRRAGRAGAAGMGSTATATQCFHSELSTETSRLCQLPKLDSDGRDADGSSITCGSGGNGLVSFA